MPPATTDSDTPAERLEAGWRSLARVHRRLEDRLEARLQADHGLSVSEFRVLRTLAEAPEGRLRMARIADEVDLTPSAASRLVARLEQRQGLVDRCLCDHDRRGVYTEITAEGRRLLAAAEATHDEALRSAWREADEAGDLETARKALARAGGEAGPEAR